MLFHDLLKRYEYPSFIHNSKKIENKKLSIKDVYKISNDEFYNDICYLKSKFIDLYIKIDDILTKKNLSDINVRLIRTLSEGISALIIDFNNIKNYEPVKKERYYYLLDRYREFFKHYISIITNQSWQSPDYGNSILQQHGLFQERIYPFQNDYQRYRVNTCDVEKLFNDSFNKINAVNNETFLFNSGMGAFITLINSFSGFGMANKIAGKNLYFEVKNFLKYQENLFFF